MIVRRLLAFLHDVLAAALAWVLAFWLRFNLDVPPEYHERMLDLLPWVVVIHAVTFWALGLYRGLWRFASLLDLKRILIAAGVAALALPAALALARLGAPVPRTAYVLTPLLLVLMMSGSRIATEFRPASVSDERPEWKECEAKTPRAPAVTIEIEGGFSPLRRETPRRGPLHRGSGDGKPG